MLYICTSVHTEHAKLVFAVQLVTLEARLGMRDCRGRGVFKRGGGGQAGGRSHKKCSSLRKGDTLRSGNGKHVAIMTNLSQTRLDVQWSLSEHFQQQLVPLQRLVPPELLNHMFHEGGHLAHMPSSTLTQSVRAHLNLFPECSHRGQVFKED